jgi:hypothetical protein
VLFGVVTNGEAIAAAANEANGSRITHVQMRLRPVNVSEFTFAFQDNLSAVPKRVWADVARKLSINEKSRNAAADLFVHASSIAFLHLLTPAVCSICSAYSRLGCLNCD